MKNKIIIFDFDGVIVNSCPLSYSINQEIIVDLGYEEWRAWGEGNVYKLKLRDGFDDQLLYKHYFERYKEQISDLSPVEGIENIFKKVLEMGYLLVIISSANEISINNFLEKYNLKKYFNEVLGKETNRSKVKKIKIILKKYKIKADETLIVTDSIGDVKEAVEANIKSIGVGWGLHEMERLKKNGANFIAKEPKDIIEGIKEILVLN